MAIIGKKLMNFSYGMGASVVVLGALFKITHLSLGPITGNFMLTLGLLVEAAIFAISAFEPVEKELDWSLVYPELAGGSNLEDLEKEGRKVKNDTESEGLLSEKLDNLLREAKVDSALISSLGNSIRNFGEVAKGIAPTVDSMASTKKYNEEISLAAAQMESLNSIYKVQLESVSRNAEINKEVSENADRLKEQMSSLSANLTSLNNVYGGMLSAMVNKH